MAEGEGTFSKGRLEAFSDGVIAVIITVMVLELKAPASAAPADLLKLWPAFLIYVVSFTFVAIYWINHHGLIGQAKAATATLIWSNNFLLLWLSLIPFATAYVAETELAPFPTMVYGALQFLCGAAFALTARVILAQRKDEADFIRASRVRARKDIAAQATYVAAIVVAAFSPPAAVLLFIGVAAAYVVPDLFGGAAKG